MKSRNQNTQPGWTFQAARAFSLIELLVVIAVIAILAGLLFTAMPAITRSRIHAVTRAELTQVTTAIEAYKADYGSYPPDGTNTVMGLTNTPLYYELTGARIAGANYVSLDGSHTVGMGAAHARLGVQGIVNSSTSVAATDDRPAIKNYLPNLKPEQFITVAGVRLLAGSSAEQAWSYRSTNPTNNPNSYDLWIDVVTGSDTTRIAH